MTSKQLSRRSFLKGAAGAAGAALGTRLLGRGLEGEAHADAEKPALLVVYLRGGYNALFSSAGGLMGKFGITASNVQDLGNGVVVDSGTLGTLGTLAKTRLSTIGVSHGLTSHDDGQMQKWWSLSDRSYVLQLAAALGGDAPIKAALVGDRRLPGARPAEGDVTLQTVLDMEATLSALGASAGDVRTPARDIAAAVLQRSAGMSEEAIKASPTSLVSLHEAYPTATAVLQRQAMRFSFDDLSTAYGLGGSTAVKGFASQIAAAELMVTAGANVVVAFDDNESWDSHGNVDGEVERNLMSTRIMPPLRKFIDRTLSDPNRNVAVAIFGDFARSLPDSDHQPNCAVTVIGKYVKTGNTGRVDASANMATGTPDVQQMWAYLAAILKAPEAPFGANPHALVR